MRRTLQTALIFLAVSAASLMAGDIKITYNTETKMGLTQKGTEVVYYSARYQRTNNEKEKKDNLVDYKSLTSYEIDHKKKVVTKFTFEDMLKLMELMAEAETEDGEKVSDVAGKMLGGKGGDKLSVERKGAEVVAGRNCEKWKISIGGHAFDASADPTLVPPIPQADLQKASKLAGGAMTAVMGKSYLDIQEEMTKIKGIHLKTAMQTKMGPMTVRTNRVATDVVEGPIPASVFELPKGYKEVDGGKKLLEDMKKQMKKK
jgi:hypothetical protein